MNLDQAGAPHQELLAPEEWTLEVTRDDNQYIIAVKRLNQPMCRLSMALMATDEGAIRTALAERARRWIREYLARPTLPKETSC